jgi:hypothetical protein
MFEYFYNEILRRTIISFGTLFNGLEIQHTDASDNTISSFKVPLAYGPTQKFLARLEQSPDLNKSTAISLPRMSFEFTGLTYDQTRKVTTTQQFITKDPTDNSEIKKAYMPVPYNLQFELSIMAKLNDDALQIVEQILPYFQPAYNLSVNLVGSINEKRDIPVILENITMQDDYEGDFTSRRVLLYTFRFTAKTYLFGPISSATSNIVKKASVTYYAGDSNNAVRNLTYSASPRAIKDYTGDVVTNLTDDLNATDLSFNVDSGSSIISKKYIDVGGEEMFVTKITGNKITVERGKDGTTISSHLRGDEIKGIDYTAREDSDLVEFGDDFGFSGSIT